MSTFTIAVLVCLALGPASAMTLRGNNNANSVPADSAPANPPAAPWKTICSGPIQKSLRFNLSGMPVPNILPDPAEGETLADAICCDSYYRSLAVAEPSGLFADPNVDLFAKKNEDGSGTFTFYDSVCGLPLFIAPRDRTLEEFKAETTHYGWPSFRDAEMVKENVVVSKSGEVHSTCGNHLGHNEPDEKGQRYCLDLVCLSGKKSTVTSAPLVSAAVFTPAATVEASAAAVELATFDGAKGTTFDFSLTNDPVMGGKSTSTFTVDAANKMAVFDGHCAIVPSLKAPGFCNAKSDLMKGFHFNKFNDASAYTHLVLEVRTTTPDYKGLKISFAADTWNPQFFSFKANFDVPAGDDFQTVTIPFDSFSNDWSSYTGDCDTTDPRGKVHHCCSKDHPEVCPTAKNLKDISQLGFWAEGHEGEFHLEIRSVGAGNASGSVFVPQVVVTM